jgi:hypothetical protein
MADSNDLNWRFIARLRLAGILVVVGLAIEMGTLLEAHPMTFISFLVGGAGLVLAGVVALVFALVAH